MPTLSLSPEYILPGQKTSITFSGLDATTTHVVMIPTKAPEGSELRQRLDKEQGKLFNVHERAKDIAFEFEPDKGGVYTFTLQEQARQPQRQIRFEGDTLGSPQTTVVAESTVTVEIGELLTIQVGAEQDICTLKVHVWGNTVRATTLGKHKIETPILEDGQTQSAINASLDDDVADAVGNLAGVTATTLLGSFTSDFSAVRVACATHFASTTYHTNSDALRALGSSYTASSLVAAKKSVNALWQSLSDHMGNVTNLDDSADPPFEPTHTSVDGTSYLLTTGAGEERSSQYMALADVLVALEVHKGVTSSHLAADVSASVSGSPLLEVFAAFARALRQTSPVTPDEQNPGAALLIQFGGFSAS